MVNQVHNCCSQQEHKMTSTMFKPWVKKWNKKREIRKEEKKTIEWSNVCLLACLCSSRTSKFKCLSVKVSQVFATTFARLAYTPVHSSLPPPMVCTIQTISSPVPCHSPAVSLRLFLIDCIWRLMSRWRQIACDFAVTLAYIDEHYIEPWNNWMWMYYAFCFFVFVFCIWVFNLILMYLFKFIVCHLFNFLRFPSGIY